MENQLSLKQLKEHLTKLDGGVQQLRLNLQATMGARDYIASLVESLEKAIPEAPEALPPVPGP